MVKFLPGFVAAWMALFACGVALALEDDSFFDHSGRRQRQDAEGARSIASWRDQAMNSRSEKFKVEAFTALEMISSGSKSLRPEEIQQCQRSAAKLFALEDSSAKAAAISIASNTAGGTDEALPILLSALKDERFAEKSLLGLERAASPESIDGLAEFIKGHADNVRLTQLAARVLGKIGTADSIASLDSLASANLGPQITEILNEAIDAANIRKTARPRAAEPGAAAANEDRMDGSARFDLIALPGDHFLSEKIVRLTFKEIQDSYPKNGLVWCCKSPDGLPVGAYTMLLSGQLDGPVTELRPQGGAEIHLLYFEGQREGPCRIWGDGDTLQLYAQYEKNKESGITCVFRSGQPWYAEIMKGGRRESACLIVPDGARPSDASLVTVPKQTTSSSSNSSSPGRSSSRGLQTTTTKKDDRPLLSFRAIETSQITKQSDSDSLDEARKKLAKMKSLISDHEAVYFKKSKTYAESIRKQLATANSKVNREAAAARDNQRRAENQAFFERLRRSGGAVLFQ